MADDKDSVQSPIQWNIEEKAQAAGSNGQAHHGFGDWELNLKDAQDWFKQRRKSSGRKQRRSSLVLQRTTTGRRWWKFTLRPWDDDEYQDWWFAGTAIPLLAATIGPLANVFSIAALVTYWRMCLLNNIESGDAHQCPWNGNPNEIGPQEYGTPYEDPHWCFDLNVVSLVAGFVGNFFLLCNFTNRIRYIIALPVTIIMWYIATGILIGITVSMHLDVPPHPPAQTYTEGFWYAVLAACMYMIASMMLMVNMLGYLLGHYPQHFTLTESQRTLILQTMLFFVWLAAGAALFSAVESKYGNGTQNWSYTNALYFCDVTILTVGFGDMYCTSDIGRGLLFPYSVGGIIMLGLMVSSIAKFAAEIGSDNIVRKHVEHSRAKTYGRTVTSSLEIERGEAFEDGRRPTISAPTNPLNRSRGTTISFADDEKKDADHKNSTPFGPLKKVASLVVKPPRQKKPKLLLLREEKDRFNAMRNIQSNTTRFKRWYALCVSFTAFGLLWCGGAVVFWRTEHIVQGMTYFEALYFCYVSLLTIGYGDFAPQTNLGRAFFVLWSLIAVPTMTILVTDLGDTVISKFRDGTVKLADFTVLPKYGVWREFLERHPWLLNWLQRRKAQKDAKRRMTEGFQVGPEEEQLPTIEDLAKDAPTKTELARKLPKKIREIVDHVKSNPDKQYSYEEWVEITQLIRFTVKSTDEERLVEEDEDLIEWDWIGEDSPMMARCGEPEFVLDRLCESMDRLVKNANNRALSTAVNRATSIHPAPAPAPFTRRRFTSVIEAEEHVDPLSTEEVAPDEDEPHEDRPTSSSSSNG